MKECITHHYACDCRESEFKKMENENKELKKDIEDLIELGTDQVVTEKIINLESQLIKAENLLMDLKNSPIITTESRIGKSHYMELLKNVFNYFREIKEEEDVKQRTI